jgi:GYF domain 2
MVYQISRGGQTYGPYTLADLKRYVESGHILLSDMAKGDEMPEWVPVSAILNPSGIPPVAPPEPVADPTYQTAYAPQPGYAPVAQFPDPPNLHWGLVLLIDVVTFGLFQIVWNFVLSAWMKRVQPNSQAMLYYVGGYGILFLNTGLSIPIYIAMLHHTHYSSNIGLSVLGLIAWALRLMARFNMKNSLEEHFNTVEPIGFRMSAVLTFFFGGLYIQSQLNRINEIKQAVRYQQFGR